MTGAVGMALGRREPAVSEVAASGVAEGPSASRLPDVLEPDPPHGADSASAKAQTSFLRPGLRVRASAERGGAGDRRARRGPDPGTDNRPSPLSLTPIRFALPMTALREAAPSACAITFALLPSSASLFRTSIDFSVDSIFRSPGSSTAQGGAVRPGHSDSTRFRDADCPAASVNGEKLVNVRWLSGTPSAATEYFEPSAASVYTVCLRPGRE